MNVEDAGFGSRLFFLHIFVLLILFYTFVS